MVKNALVTKSLLPLRFDVFAELVDTVGDLLVVAVDLVLQGSEALIYSIEVFSPEAFIEGEDDQGCGGDRGNGSGVEGERA